MTNGEPSNTDTRSCCDKLKFICNGDNFGNLCSTKDGDLDGKPMDDFRSCCKKRKLEGNQLASPTTPTAPCK